MAVDYVAYSALDTKTNVKSNCETYQMVRGLLQDCQNAGNFHFHSSRVVYDERASIEYFLKFGKKTQIRNSGLPCNIAAPS